MVGYLNGMSQEQHNLACMRLCLRHPANVLYVLRILYVNQSKILVGSEKKSLFVTSQPCLQKSPRFSESIFSPRFVSFEFRCLVK